MSMVGNVGWICIRIVLRYLLLRYLIVVYSYYESILELWLWVDPIANSKITFIKYSTSTYFMKRSAYKTSWAPAYSLAFNRMVFVAVSKSGCTALETMPSQVNLIIINQSYQSYQYLKNKRVMLGGRHGLITNLIEFTTLLLDLKIRK